MRLCIAGLGVVTCLGVGVPANRERLRTGKGGIELGSSHLKIPVPSLPVGEVPLDNQSLRDALGIAQGEGFISRTALLGMLAARECLEAASVNAAPERIGFINGTTVGGMDGGERFYARYSSEGKADLGLLKMYDCGAIERAIASYCGIQGYRTSVSTACSSGANAVLLGAQLIAHGRLDAVLVGGCDALTLFTINGFRSLRIYSEEVCRPFDRERSGLNLGEGAAYLLLCREECLRPGERVFGYYLGGANRNDAYHQTASSPDGRGAVLTMQAALKQADCQPEHVQYVNAHGTGTMVNDSSEGAALQRVFSRGVPLFNSTKGYTGHTLGAAGAIEAVFTVLSILQGEVYASLGFHAAEEGGLSPVTEYREVPALRLAMSNSFGFGGNSCSLLFGSSRGYL